MRGWRRLAACLALGAMTICLAGCFTANVSGGMITRPGLDAAKAAGERRMVSHFEKSKRSGWLLFALIPMTGAAGSDSDWSYDTVVKEIERSQGDAAINVAVKSQFDIVDIIVGIFIGGLYNTEKYTVSGDIVKFE